MGSKISLIGVVQIYGSISKPCPGNPCEGRNPSASARSWQGKDPYPGKDSYKNVVLKKGTILYTLHPHGRDENPLKNPTPNYFGKTQQVLKMQGKGARAYNDALQLSHDENTPGSRYKVRKQLHQFVVTQDICIAQGFAKENPHLGTGGGQQIFVMNKDKNYLEAIGKLFNLE